MYCTIVLYKPRVFETERKDSTGSFLFHCKQVVLYLHFLPFTGFFCFIVPVSYSIFLFYCYITFLSLPHPQHAIFTTLYHGLVLRPIYAFCFNAPCQFTRFLNLCCMFFGLTPFGWFIYIYLSLFFRMGISLLIYAHFFRAN
jgi:hypothetical protein